MKKNLTLSWIVLVITVVLSVVVINVMVSSGRAITKINPCPLILVIGVGGIGFCRLRVRESFRFIGYMNLYIAVLLALSCGYYAVLSAIAGKIAYTIGYTVLGIVIGIFLGWLSLDVLKKTSNHKKTVS